MNTFKYLTPLQKKVYIGVIVVVVLITAITLKLKLSSRQDTSDYVAIVDVPGTEFLVPKALVNSATAVTEIGEKSGLSSDRLYTYTNGEDFYMMFCMEQYVFVVKRGTTFNIKENGIAKAFSDNSLNGIWFEQISGSDSIIKRDYCKVDVMAQISLTPKLYNDFYGKLMTIVDEDGVEYTYFAGCTDWMKSDDLNKVFDFAVSSLDSRDLQALETEKSDIDYIDTETGVVHEVVADAEIPEDTAPTPAAPEVSETPEPSPEPAVTPETTVTPEPVVTPEETVTAPEPVVQPEETVPSDPEPAVDPNDHSVGATVGTNQKEKIVVSGEVAIVTDIYSMLDIGGTAAAYAVYEEGPLMGTANPVCVCLTRTYNDAETRLMVNEYINSGNFWGGDTFTTPEGCHLEAASYNLMFTEDAGSQYTVDVRIRGLDGRNLVYNGVTYPQRTYVLPSKMERWNNWYMNNIVFYVVPDGCNEYAISIAGVKEGNSTYSAWYRVDENP